MSFGADTWPRKREAEAAATREKKCLVIWNKENCPRGGKAGQRAELPAEPRALGSSTAAAAEAARATTRGAAATTQPREGAPRKATPLNEVVHTQTPLELEPEEDRASIILFGAAPTA